MPRSSGVKAWVHLACGVAFNKGEPLPSGCQIGGLGQPTQDPHCNILPPSDLLGDRGPFEVKARALIERAEANPPREGCGPVQVAPARWRCRKSLRSASSVSVLCVQVLAAAEEPNFGVVYACVLGNQDGLKNVASRLGKTAIGPSAMDGKASATTSRRATAGHPPHPLPPDERHPMKGLQRSILAGALGLLTALQVQAAPVGLFDYAFNIDGAVTSQAAPPGVNLAGFDTGTGLGTITITVGTAGDHYVSLFVDHEIDEVTNTFFNEFGATTGSAGAGQSWEIDEPEYVFGDIWTNFRTSTLDGTNGVPGTAPDDVSMAQAWTFTLLTGETAVLQFWIGGQPPVGTAFYMTQTDPDSQASIYFGSSLRIDSGGNAPEPSSLALVGLALLGAALVHRRVRR